MSGVSTLRLRRSILRQFFVGEVPDFTHYSVCLTRRVPTTNSAVSQLDEPPATMGYARPRVGRVGTDSSRGGSWAMLNDQEVKFTGRIDFPRATEFWGTLHGWAMLSFPGDGHVLAVGTLNEPFKCVAGMRPYLDDGDLTFGLFD